MKFEAHNAQSALAGFSNASNWAEIRELRTKLGFSQANIAGLLEIDQTQISRYESLGKEVSSEERAALGSIETVLADKPLKGAMKRLQKVQHIIVGTQEAGGTLLGTILDATLPPAMKRAAVRALMKEQDVFLTNDPNSKEKVQAAIMAGPIGERISAFVRRIRQAVAEERWEDICLMAPAVLEATENDPSVRVLLVSIKHNYGLAVEMYERNFGKARAIFEEVAQDSAADVRDKAIAIYEIGYSWMEEVILPGTSLSVVRKAANDAESHFIEAARIYPENAIPGQALLHLADKLLDLGDPIWSKELLTKAGDIFSNGDIEPIMSKIKSWEDARTRWPNLMRKRGWLKPILKWLSVVVAAAFLSAASCNAGTIVEKPSWHQGNRTLALDVSHEHQGNSLLRAIA